MDRKAYLTAKFGGADRALEIYGHIRAVGEQVGIPFRFEDIPRTPSTLNAHRLIRYAQQSGTSGADALVPLLFEAYFLQGRDLGDLDVLVDIAAEAGLDAMATRAYLESGADTDEIQAEDVFARRLGIGGVPCFIIDGKYALSGAQEPEAFLPLLDMAMQESAQRPESADV
jgi:predicted DsbA family dithiol-disulfide isomerase